VKVEKIYRWLILQLEENESVTEDELKKRLGLDEIEHALFLLNYLVSKKLVSVRIYGTDRKYDVTDLDKIKSLLKIKREKPIVKKSKKIVESLVVNVPLSLSNELDTLLQSYPGLTVLSMKEAFRILFNVTKVKISLSLPFFEFDGLIHFVDEIKTLAKRGVNIDVLSRGILIPEKEGYPYVEKLKAFHKLIDIYENNKSFPEAKLRIRDYSSRISDYSSTSLHYEGIHQKMIIADRKYAYIGSGEIRAASFLTNGDIGAIHVGKKAEFWDDFFKLFWKSAKPVSYDFFDRVINR